MKKILLVLLTCFVFVNVLAQEKMKELTEEREILYQKYKESENLSTGLFGNRSKDDMQKTIEALTEIIDKDNEILNEYKSIQSNANATFTDKYNQLIQENNDLTQKNHDLVELTERHKGFSKENHQMLEEIEKYQGLYIALLGFSVLLAIVYIIKYFSLKSKMKNSEK